MSCRQLTSFIALLFIVTGTLRAEIKPDFLMDSDPDFHVADRLKRFEVDFKGIWLQALDRPEIDLQRMAAETIAQGHQYGIPGLIEAVPTLEQILVLESSHPSARFAAARALIVLESRSSSEKLVKASRDFGVELKQLVEPVMADWDIASARQIWLKRLETPKTRSRELILALRGLGRVREVAARPTMLKLALDLNQTFDIRLEAATAAGQLADSGLEQEAEHLCHESRRLQIVNRLCAIRLLGRHSSDTARKQLLELAADTEPSIVGAALKRLNEIDPTLVLPLAEVALKNPDQLVREQAANAYLSLPTPERIEPLSLLLDDPHPALRRRLCEALYRLARKPDLDEPIRLAATKVLAGDHWRGQEQAGLLLGALEHKPVSQRLVELLESPRGEVSVAVAWALRKVAVPETIPAMLEKIRRQTEIRQMVFLTEIDLQVAHLFEACGKLRAVEARPQFLQYVPKNLKMGERSRSAAIWALGWLHDGVPDDALAQAFIERATDPALMPPENILVKQMSVISIARMKAVKHAPAIRKIIEMETPPSHLGLAHRWAIKELTGEELPEPKPQFLGEGTWFLEPLR